MKIKTVIPAMTSYRLTRLFIAVRPATMTDIKLLFGVIASLLLISVATLFAEGRY
jgi:hypothetical protein